jgi:archaellum component FlaC
VLEVNAIYFILLAEGFVLLLILLLVWVLITLISKRQKSRSIAELQARVKHRSLLRSEQTKSFLQTIYHLEGEDLSAALADIEHHETEFFQHLIDSLYRGGRAQLTTMDIALDKLIESYKCLQPRSESISQEEQEAVQEIVSLRVENETLRSELSVAKNKLSNTISEFGDMFGGGKDHQLALHEVVERIDAMKADNDPGEPLKAQK